MLSYITEPLRKLFSSRNAITVKRKREKSSMIPQDCEIEEPASKKSRCKPQEIGQFKPSCKPGSFPLGSYIQDWFAKIGQMAVKPVEPFNIGHVTHAEGDYDNEDDSDSDIKEMPLFNGDNNSHYSQSLTREPLHTESTPRVCANGTSRKVHEEEEEDYHTVSDDDDDDNDSNDVVILPYPPGSGNGLATEKEGSRKTKSKFEIDYLGPESSKSLSLKKYYSRDNTFKRSVSPLEPIRISEREQYRMLLEHCQAGSQLEPHMAVPCYSKFQSAPFSTQRASTRPEGVSKTRLSENSRKNLMDRLCSDSDLLRSSSSLKEGVRSRSTKNSFSVSKHQSLGQGTPTVGNLANKVPQWQTERGSSPPPFSRQHKPHLEMWEDISVPAEVKTDSVRPKDSRRRSMPIIQKEVFSKEWLSDIQTSIDDCCMSRARKEEKLKLRTQELREKREAKIFADNRKVLQRLVKTLSLKDGEEEEDVAPFPELTPEMERKIEEWLRPTPPDEVLCEGFRLSITRRDMETLSGLNWLNDEIINFYMNLLMERGKNDNFPSVYAFNTFFYPKLISGGHSALRRWTRQVDIFSYHYVLIPVHLGLHWCLAVIDFKQKKIQYYDSMGGQNNDCVNALKTYLQDESRDKKKQEFDMSEWKFETVKNIPQQMNGSDCGMFTLKYAEYITRNAKITFSQRNMPYFRRRMVYEIVTRKLL